MNQRFKRVLLYYLPALANLGLIAYLVWQLNLVPYYRRQGEFEVFSALYAIGGLVVAVSGVTALLHAVSDGKGSRRLFVLALVNTIVPTVVLLAMLQFR